MTTNERTEGRSWLFSVQLWRMAGDGADEHRGRVRDVATGAHRGFRSWGELTAFLAEQVEERAPAEEGLR